MKQKEYSIRQNVSWMKKKIGIHTPAMIWWIPLGILLTVITSVLASVLPAYVTWALQTTNNRYISLMGVVFLAVVLGAAIWYSGQLETQKFWQNLTMRQNIIFDEIHIYLHQPYMDAASQENQRQREISRKQGYDDDDSGVGQFFPSLVHLLESLSAVFIMVLLTTLVNLWIPIVTLCTMAISFFVLNKFNSLRTKAKMELDKDRLKRDYFVQTAFDDKASQDIRLYDMKKHIVSELKLSERKIILVEKKISKYQLLSDSINQILASIRLAIAYLLLFNTVQKLNLSLSIFAFYFSLLGSMEFQIQAAWKNYRFLKAASTDISVGRQYLDLRVAKDEEIVKHEQTEIGDASIEFIDVNFAYPGTKSNILSGINLKIHAGEHIALVGTNGAGKTTLTLLLMGLFKPTSGKILIGGVDADLFTESERLNIFSVMFQENIILAGNVATNISLALPPDDDKVQAAIHSADFTKVVDRLPQRCDTEMTQYISDSGINLSGGEIQKLMLARMIYHDRPIMILDEPTAALDALAENSLYQKIDEISQGITTIFISHRLSSTKDSDRIILLKDGRIDAVGTHENLLASNATYAAMYDSQAQYYKKGDA